MLICKALKHLCNSKKGLRKSATLNDNLSMKFYTHKKEAQKKSSLSTSSIFLKVVEFKSNDLKMFINTLWYDNVNDYDCLKLKNVLPLKIYLG